MSASGDRQASFRAIGGTAGPITGDMLAAFEAEAVIPPGISFNGAMITWLQARLATTEPRLQSLMQQFADAEDADNWASLGSFDPVFGLIDFGEDNAATANRHYVIPHVDALDCIAATGWAWGCFTRLDQNAGSAFQYLLSSGALNANPSFNLLISEASASPANRYDVNVGDANTDHNIEGAAGQVTLGQLRLIVAQADGVNETLWICDPGEEPVLVGTTTAPDGDVIAPGNWFFGRRSDGETARYYQEHAGNLWKADRGLAADEIEAIAVKRSPYAVLGSALAEWWPFANGAGATEVGMIQGIVATRVGTWA